MGGVGSGGHGSSGRTKFALVSYCEFCRTRVVSHRTDRRFCDAHQKPAQRRGDQAALVLSHALVALRAFERQFAPFPEIAAPVVTVRLRLERQLRTGGQSSPAGIRPARVLELTAQEPSPATAQDARATAPAFTPAGGNGVDATTQEPSSATVQEQTTLTTHVSGGV